MMKILKNNIIYIIIIIILLCHSPIINLLSNLSRSKKDEYDIVITENNILKTENKYLKNELIELNKLSEFSNYDFKISRLSYRNINNKNIFYINGGASEEFKKNDALVNKDGLVGLIDKVYSTYSRCNTLYELNNLSIKINDSYGTISENKYNLLISNDFSIDDIVNLNDIVYTSELGSIKTSIKIGKVKSIDETNISKTVYIEPFVNFNDISYLYVVGE